jgi:hypothetical protein
MITQKKNIKMNTDISLLVLTDSNDTNNIQLNDR